LCEVNGENRVNVGGCEDDLVVVAVTGAVGVSGSARRTVTAAAAAVTGVTHGAILGVEGASTWIIHKLAFAAGAKVAVLARVGVVVVVVVAAVVDAASVVACWLAFDAIVVVVGAVVLTVCCLAFDVAVRGVVVVLGNLHLLQLRYRGCIAVSNSWDISFFLHLVANRLVFSGFGLT